MTSLSRLRDAIRPLAPDAAVEAQRHLDTLTKPPGSLGRLEEIAVRLAALRGRAPRVDRPVVFTFAADHGVVAEGVSAYPQAVTAQMVENFLRGGAAINVLARQAGARVVVADFGIAGRFVGDARPAPAEGGVLGVRDGSLPAIPKSATTTRAPAWRASTLMAAPPRRKFSTICAVTTCG
jgi:NaMN:DMB phosphoribosyltransferase